MGTYVIGLQDTDQAAIKWVGGKGASLGELSRLEGIRVPEGFCVTTEAFARVIGDSPAIGALLDRLSAVSADEREEIRTLSGELRNAIEGAPLPEDLVDTITRHLSQLGDEAAYAVRSSATAEDLPTASFAGQHDTYLNVIGKPAILRHISRCWASLFTERAIIYRLQNGFDHRSVQQAVVVQKLVVPEVAGMLFTADPVTGNRNVTSIDASYGLGEALVSGLVNADTYHVRNGKAIAKTLAPKIEPERQNSQVLTDEQILRLAELGRTVEAHFGQPQDIEWCLADETFYLLQSRPITTLFPVPDADDDEPRVYVSVGHQQMMTDPLKPLGLSFFQLTAMRPMATAGGRLFVEISQDLASPARRQGVVEALGKSDPLIKDALTTLLEREDFLPVPPQEEGTAGAGNGKASALPSRFQTLKDYEPTIVSELIARSQAALDALKQAIATRSGPELFDFILDDLRKLKTLMADPDSLGVIVTAMNAAFWINDNMRDWLGEINAADALSQSAPHNVTAEMGLALLDVADVIRPYPEVVTVLREARDASFLDDLLKVEGGREARDAIQAYLDTYGMRCTGEIDITRPRWSETPTTLVPMILSNLSNFEPQARQRKFEQGLQAASRQEASLLARVKLLPDGASKAEEAQRMIRLIRTLSGYREYPKYVIVSHYFVYKQALQQEARRLVQANVLREAGDIDYLTFEELREVVITQRVDEAVIRRRKEAFKHYERLTPPRVLTSEGEIITGDYRRGHLPADTLVGLPVSSGVIEGRARVLASLEEADLEEGDILVTTYTDPSWTPLFVSIKGLVTEVGGLMTHGAVIAREYGLPAVIGVENATRLIRDGQRIRVNGSAGTVEIL